MKGLIFSSSSTSRNLGAYRIAYILRNYGWDIEVIDFFPHWSEQEIKQLLKQRINSDTKFVGYSTLFFKEETVPYWLFEHIKKTYPDTVTMFGTQVQTGIDHEDIDYTLSGWADHSIVVLLKYLFSNGEVPEFNQNKKTKNINSTQSYPAFPLKRLTVTYQDRDYVEPYETLPIELSRGCKFKCKFCNFPVLGVKNDHSRSTTDFEFQLKDAYDRFGVTKYILSDETVNDSLGKIIKYADVVERLPFMPIFSGFMRADLLIRHPAQRQELLRMNLLAHYYGIESLNYESAKAIGKGMHSEKIKDGLVEVKEFFESNGSRRYRGTIGLIVGLPYETEETMESSINWLKNNWHSQAINSYVLEIPLGAVDNKSNFSLEYEKYGYKEHKNLTEDEKSIIHNFQNREHDNVRVGNEYLIWKNKDLTMVKSIEIFNKIKALYPEFKINNFGLFELTELNFNLKRKEHLDLDFYPNNLIANYKIKKLNN